MESVWLGLNCRVRVPCKSSYTLRDLSYLVLPLLITGVTVLTADVSNTVLLLHLI